MDFDIKIASLEEMETKWNFEIGNHVNDDRWIYWKEIAIKNARNGYRLCFYGFLKV